MAAAFELSHPANPECGKYEITVYTPGWRLGGKAASGRRRFHGAAGGSPNSIIEERDAYLWFGFFENSFRMIRDLYQEWTGDPDTWRDVFDTATITAAPLSAEGKKLRLCKYDLPPGEGPAGGRRTMDRRRSAEQALEILADFAAGLGATAGRGCQTAPELFARR